MIVAFLFNADDPKFGATYGAPISKLILSTGILQQSGRHLKVSSGDVLMLSIAKPKRKQEIIPFCEQTYFWHSWNHVLAEKIRAIYLKSTICAWVIENITEEIAKLLHSALKEDSAYLGMHAVDYSHAIHSELYRNYMIPMCRIQGKECSIYYSRAHGDDRNYGGFSMFEDFGFKVKWEDTGVRFDLCNTLEHRTQINDFIEVVSPFFDGGQDKAEELAMLLDDLNPRLFNSLSAAAQAFKRAKNEEHFAHVGLSGRRYMEQLADEVFPVSDRKIYNGYEVGQHQYINRLRAFITDLPIDELDRKGLDRKGLGDEVNRVYKKFNKIIHDAVSTRYETGQTYADVAILTLTLLSIIPKKTYRPYFPHRRYKREGDELVPIGDMTEEDLIFPHF